MTELSKANIRKLSVNPLYDAKIRRSFCWKHFGNLILTDNNKKKIVNSDQVYCLACFTAIKSESQDITFGSVKIKSYNKTVSTGNLTRHLREDHQVRDEPRRADKSKSTNTKDFFKITRSTKTSSTSCARFDKWLLAKDLALWFCKSLLPFDSVSDEGMLDFFKKHNLIVNDDDIPSRYTVSGSALSEAYESMLYEVKENISIDGASHCAITFDLWTDQYRRLSYITFTLHYLTSDFQLKVFTLGTDIITKKETGERIKDVIEDIKKKFALIEKSIIAVTDAGANVKQAVSLADMTHHLCLGHGLHNLVTVDGINSIPEIATLVQKIKKIVKAMRYRAPVLLAEAENKQQQQQKLLSSIDTVIETIENDEADPILEDDLTIITKKYDEFKDRTLPSEEGYSKHIPTIKTATPTRWHSVLEMLESVIHVCNRDPINNMLSRINQDELKITQYEWILLEELVKFLKSFREVVEIMSSQKTCTINVALVFRSEIIDILNNLQDDESQIMLRLKRHMLANINKRFPVNKAIVAAALLDCRFMGLKEVDAFLDDQHMTRTSFLSSYIREIISINNMPEATSTITDNDTSLMLKLSKKHSSSACQGIQDDPIEQECWRYIAAADPTEPKDGDLLSYWNSKKEVFPNISALARALLCVPATSTPSERVFSVAGLSITAKRSRLNPTRVNKIIFIHDNYKSCKIDSIKHE